MIDVRTYITMYYGPIPVNSPICVLSENKVSQNHLSAGWTSVGSKSIKVDFEWLEKVSVRHGTVPQMQK